MGEREINDLAVARAGLRLDQSAGHFLTNTIYLPKLTCRRCKGIVHLDDRDLCERCHAYAGPNCADLMGSLIYACSGADSGRLMRGYKEAVSTQDSEAILLLLLLGLSHNDCARKAVGCAFTHWASVPSLRHFNREHPLHRIVHQLPGLPMTQVDVRASEAGKAAGYNEGRSFNAGHFDVVSAIPPGAHVLVIEDTWVSGGHAESVAAALKSGGASKVSILAVARWLDMDDPRTRHTYHDAFASRPFDSSLCPWLNQRCRPRAASSKAKRRGSSTSPKAGPVRTWQAERVASPTNNRAAMACSLHGIALDKSGSCGACAKLTAPPQPLVSEPTPEGRHRSKPWWQFW